MKILFTTAHYHEWCHVAYTYSLYQTKWPKGAEVEIASCMGCSLAKANENFARIALDGNYDYMIQACNDGGWRSDSILKLIQDNKDVVTGWSSARFHPFEVKAFITINRPNVTMGYRRGLGSGLERVYSIASELAVFKVDVFRRIKPPWFSGVLNPKGEPTTDDFAFGCKAYDAGVEIWLDWNVPIRHHAAGMMTEGGKLRAM